MSFLSHNWKLFVSSLPLLVGFAWQTSLAAPAATTPVAIERTVLLDYLAGNGIFTLVDARSPTEFASGHVVRAINIPHDDVVGSFDRLPTDIDAPIVTYCSTGRRAADLASTLKMMGYTHVVALAPQQLFWADQLPVFNCGSEPQDGLSASDLIDEQLQRITQTGVNQ
ncbi:MAG: rhodanese-like domain-containing protein [Gammaproteobacteria bacterium]|nr:rhodanese-like domain-containing protein [Gammaproteobacteria bacterium]